MSCFSFSQNRKTSCVFIINTNKYMIIYLKDKETVPWVGLDV